MNKILLVDVDGVLLNWADAFGSWMNSLGHNECGDLGSYCLGERYQIPVLRARELIAEFNRSAAVGDCAPFRDAQEHVIKLSREGWHFHALTAFGGDRWSRALRVQNLERHFGRYTFQTIDFCGLNESKDHMLERYNGTGHHWIEDKPENAHAGLKFGLKPILLKHGYTGTPHEDIEVVESWKDIYEKVNAPRTMDA